MSDNEGLNPIDHWCGAVSRQTYLRIQQERLAANKKTELRNQELLDEDQEFNKQLELLIATTFKNEDFESQKLQTHYKLIYLLDLILDSIENNAFGAWLKSLVDAQGGQEPVS